LTRAATRVQLHGLFLGCRLPGPALLLFSLQLVSADISFEASEGIATGSYRFAQGVDSVRFTAARTGEISDFEVAGGALTVETGLYHFTVTAPNPAATIEIAYSVDAGSGRIPIFVPDVPTEATRGAVVIRIAGVAEDARVKDGFPRMERLDDGTVEARPANVPSFLILPPPAGGVGVNQVADWFVIFMLLGATGYWLWWRRR
jgi:hypothetical protein